MGKLKDNFVDVIWIIRSIWSWLDKIFRLQALFSSKLLLRFSASICAVYFLCLDVRGDDAWIKEYKTLHTFLFYFLIGVTSIANFVQSFVKPEDEKLKASNKVLAGFISSIGLIVESKIRRFRGKLPVIASKASRFDEITQPQDQMRVISQEAINFLCSHYGLNDNQVDITIAKRRSASGGWSWLYLHQQWNHSDANHALRSGSAGSTCTQTGERLFFPDKTLAALDGKYIASRRDKERSPGSAYAYPLRITGPSEDLSFVICIVTYSKRLCDPGDDAAKKPTESILRELCRRFELELCLQILKDSRWPSIKKIPWQAQPAP